MYVYVFVLQERNIQLNFHNFILRYGPFLTYHGCHRSKWQMDVKRAFFRQQCRANQFGTIGSNQNPQNRFRQGTKRMSEAVAKLKNQEQNMTSNPDNPSREQNT